MLDLRYSTCRQPRPLHHAGPKRIQLGVVVGSFGASHYTTQASLAAGASHYTTPDLNELE